MNNKIKHICLFLIFIGFFTLSNKVQAISGACSYHGGVNCTIGANYLGNAICNDGWQSTTSFYDTDECQYQKNVSACTYPLSYNGCTTLDDLNRMSAEYRGLNIGNGYLPQSDNQTSSLSQCSEQIDSYNVEMDAYNQCMRNLYNYDPVSEQFAPTQVVLPTEAQAEKLYDEEFQNFALPVLKDTFPNATLQQLQEAKNELRVLATSERYLQTPLAQIIPAEPAVFIKIFKVSSTNPIYTPVALRTMPTSTINNAWSPITKPTSSSAGFPNILRNVTNPFERVGMQQTPISTSSIIVSSSTNEKSGGSNNESFFSRMIGFLSKFWLYKAVIR